MSTQEVRSFTSSIEIRDGTASRTITGYPIVFNKPSQDLGGFVEYIAPTALDGVNLSEVLLVRSHEFDQVLARSDSGTLKLSVDKVGLRFEATLPNTTLGNDTLEDIRVGNIKGMSFSFTTRSDDWAFGGAGKPDIRTVNQIDQVFEITLTPIPAYQDTTVAIAARDAKTKGYSLRARLKDTVTLAKIREEIA